MRPALMALGAALLMTSLLCLARPNRGMLTGQLRDPFGHGIAGTLRIDGLAGRVATREDGRYQLPYIPGRLHLIAEAPGHISAERVLDLYAPAQVEVAALELTPEPPAPGLWRWRDDGYMALAEALLILSAGARGGLELRSRPHTICLGETLVSVTEARGARGPSAPTLVEVTARGALLLDEPAPAGALSMKEISQGVFLLSLHSPGEWALLTGGATAFGGVQAVSLRGAPCGAVTGEGP